MKVTLQHEQATLLLTLYARGTDAQSEHPILNDRMSVSILEKIDYDLSFMKTAWMSYYGILCRARVMDREVRRFLEGYPEATVVDIGCGLDTRFYRCDNGRAHWVMVDMPDVIALREQLFEEHPRVTVVGQSCLDSSWTEAVKEKNGPLLIISEGVLMYLSEEEIQQFLTILTDFFSQFEAHFDLLWKGVVGRGRHHDALKYMDAEFRFGVSDGSELVRLHPPLKQIGLINFTDELRHWLRGGKKLMIPFFYVMNNRLGMYEYHSKK